ncbi:MAG: glycosyltransferase family 4 protein [Deltaproteobacteria bacterium]
MKILIYTHEFPPFAGGLATTSLKLAKGISKAGAELAVLAPGYSSNDSAADGKFDFKVLRMSALSRNHGVPSPAKEIVGYFALKRTIASERPDAVFFITREAHAAGGLLANYPFKVIVRVAGYEAIRYLLGARLGRRALAVPMRRLYLNAHKIISPSVSTANLLEEAKIPPSMVKVIYNGVNSTMLSPPSSPEALEELRRGLGIDRGDKVILTVSRVVPGKGQDRVIKALPQILSEFGGNLKYLIIGGGSHEREFKALAQSKGVSGNVIFWGSVPHGEVINYYDAADVFILANRTIREKENIEGLPNVVLEAAARGLPIIAGEDGGGKEAVIDGGSGYALRREDGSGKIAEYLLELLRDDAKARSFGQEGRRRIERFFTEERMIQEYLDVLGLG